MKAYGLPRVFGFDWPDVVDIKEFARPGSAGHLRGKSGQFRSYFKNSAAKRATRRYYKRRARAAGRLACSEE